VGRDPASTDTKSKREDTAKGWEGDSEEPSQRIQQSSSKQHRGGIPLPKGGRGEVLEGKRSIANGFGLKKIEGDRDAGKTHDRWALLQELSEKTAVSIPGGKGGKKMSPNQ